MSLKCDPALAEILRANYAGVGAGYHLNKQHWNTVALDAGIPWKDIEAWVQHSYELVAASLTGAKRGALGVEDSTTAPRPAPTSRPAIRTQPQQRATWNPLIADRTTMSGEHEDCADAGGVGT